MLFPLYLSSQHRFTQMISSFPLCLSLRHWKWPSRPIPALAMKVPMFRRLSCLMKSCRQTLPPRRTFLTRRKELISPHLLVDDSSQEFTNAPSVTNASSITQSSWNTSACTAACSRTTAPSVGGRSERPRCWQVTGCANVKMLRTCALNVGTVSPRHWTNSDTTARSGAVTMTVDTAERVSKSPAA